MKQEITSICSYADKEKGIVLTLDPITADVSIWDYNYDSELLGEHLIDISGSKIERTPSKFFKPNNFVLDIAKTVVAKEGTSVVDQILNAKPGTSIVLKMKDEDDKIVEGYVTKLMWSNNYIYLLYDSSDTLLNYISVNYGVLREDPEDIDELLCEWNVLGL